MAAATKGGTGKMNVMFDEETVKARLEELRGEHRALDDEIAALAEALRTDQITVRRLKKRKLHLKDEISRLQDLLYPDIIA